MALGAAELLRPLVGLTFITGIAELPPSMYGLTSVCCGCGFFDGFPTDAETARFETAPTDAETARFGGGGGAGGGGLLAPAACVDGWRFVVNFVGTVGGSIFAAVGSTFSDPALERALLTTTGLTLLLSTPFNAPGPLIPAGGGGGPGGGGPGSIAIASFGF